MVKSLIQATFEFGYIDSVQKEKAERYKAETGQSDDSVIRDTKILSEEIIVKLYSKIYQMPVETLADISDRSIAQKINVKELYRLYFFPVSYREKIKIYTAQPANLIYAEDMLREVLGYRGSFFYAIVSLNELTSFIAEVFEKNNPEVLAEFETTDNV